MNCPRCNTTLLLQIGVKLNRSEQCPACKEDLKTCRNCEFYDSSAQWECREHISEPVLEKSKANFCDFFRLGNKLHSEDKKKDNLLSAAEALFKKR